MAIFINSKDDKLINLYYVQNIVINPENDKEIIIYNKNGESIIESYDTAEEASTAYDNYVTKMEESSGGGGGAKLQTKSVTITENGTNTILPDENYNGMNKVNLTVDVAGSEYNAKVNTVISKYEASLIKNIVKLPEMDTSNIESFNSFFSGCINLESIPLLNTSKSTGFGSAFYQCTKITEIPLLDTSKSYTFNNAFGACTNLVTIPKLDTSRATSMQGMFSGCNKLSNETLNNVLKMCIDAVNFTGTKTLAYVGLSSSQATTCQSLSNYQAFLDAGWTTGY